VSASSAPRIPAAPASTVELRPRAKPLRPWERRHDAEDPADPFASAAIVDLSMVELGLTNTEVARYLGVSEVVVREMRTGHRVLTAPRIQRLPRPLAVLILRKLLHLFHEG
jgi:hypothetical protein